MSNDDLTHENFDFRGFDVPDLKAVTLASSSDGDQSKQPKTKHEDASKNRKHGKKKSKSDARSKKRAGAGKTSESFDDYEEREAVSKADKKVSKDRPGLFAPMTLREVTVRNRIWLPPMCTYSSFARDGRPTPFHYQHYVSRAFGGFGMVIVESTAVAPEGRITPCDLGLWEDGQIDAWRWIVDGIREAGAVPAIQLNHAGRKASTGCFAVGYDGQNVPEEAGGWPTMAPSEIAFGGLRTPRALSVDEIHGLVGAFAVAAGRAVAAGFQAIQIHAAHGYLISQFLDPLSNERDDEYGGDLTGRSRFLVEVVDAVRGAVPEGRITPCDLGLWEDGQIDAWRWIVDGIREAGAVPAIQLNHAGRKASTGCFAVGYDGQNVPEEAGGWPTMAPSEIAFGGLRTPRALSVDEIHGLVGAFAVAAGRAVAAGFQAIQIHAAHGYLISQFLDPLSNERDDEYGGDLTGRSRFLVEVVDAVRGAVPEGVPVLVRISATDWAAGGWDLDQTIALSKVLKEHGVDVMDVSTGGIMSGVSIPVKPNYQVPFSEQVKAKADIPVTAVGLITKPKQAAKILAHGEADAVEIGRAALRDPYWPLRAANKLGIPSTEIPYAPQYVAGAY